MSLDITVGPTTLGTNQLRSLIASILTDENGDANFLTNEDGIEAEIFQEVQIISLPADLATIVYSRGSVECGPTETIEITRE